MTTRRTFETQFFRLSVDGLLEEYDIVIVGSGFGGGVLAADLFDKNEKSMPQKKILVIERGNLIFSTHCLNTARPGGTGDSGQQNDAFFKEFKDNYQLENESDDFEGGPVFALGGRSSVWGLFIPRPHHSTFVDHFPPEVVSELDDTYFDSAESLLRLGYPETKVVHQKIIDELNRVDSSCVRWQWGRIASEFKGSSNFRLAGGAYGTVDKLLGIAMVADQQPNFHILLNTEVRCLAFGEDGTTLKVKDDKGNEGSVKAKNVVLCAGSVHSAGILLRSGLDMNTLGGGRLTDHSMYLVKRLYTYPEDEPERWKDVGSMKLQTFTKLGEKNQYHTLANISIDASSFLGHSQDEGNGQCRTFLMVFILPSKLGANNAITLGEDDEPHVLISRTDDADDETKDAMAEMVKNAMDVMKKELGVTFKEEAPSGKDLTPLPLGNVAHELGSIPMPSPQCSGSVVDTDLQLNDHKGVYVCDLSVFPFSTAANPSLTLAALALRLSAHLFK